MLMFAPCNDLQLQCFIFQQDMWVNVLCMMRGVSLSGFGRARCYFLYPKVRAPLPALLALGPNKYK